MDHSVKLVGGHNQITLPWKYENPTLPNNRWRAEQRLELLKKRLKRDTNLFEKYKETMNDYLDKGHDQRIAPNLSLPSNIAPGTCTWYLLHHPVTHPQKPEKAKVIFDCAAKYQNTSLNQQLLQGPDETNSLVGVFLRFQQERVAVMADVEKMFHQVCIKPEDCEALSSYGGLKGTLIETLLIIRWLCTFLERHPRRAAPCTPCRGQRKTTKVNLVCNLSRRCTTISM